MKKLSRLLLALLMLSVLLLPALELEVQAYRSIYLRVYDRCTNTYMGIPIHVTGNGVDVTVYNTDDLVAAGLEEGRTYTFSASYDGYETPTTQITLPRGTGSSADVNYYVYKQYDVTVTVRDTLGQPLSGQSVQVSHPDLNAAYTTDGNGQFTVKDIRGLFTVKAQVTVDGETVSGSVIAREDQSLELTVPLRQKVSVKLTNGSADITQATVTVGDARLTHVGGNVYEGSVVRTAQTVSLPLKISAKGYVPVEETVSVGGSPLSKTYALRLLGASLVDGSGTAVAGSVELQTGSSYVWTAEDSTVPEGAVCTLRDVDGTLDGHVALVQSGNSWTVTPTAATSSAGTLRLEYRIGSETVASRDVRVTVARGSCAYPAAPTLTSPTLDASAATFRLPADLKLAKSLTVTATGGEEGISVSQTYTDLSSGTVTLPLSDGVVRGRVSFSFAYTSDAVDYTGSAPGSSADFYALVARRSLAASAFEYTGSPIKPTVGGSEVASHSYASYCSGDYPFMIREEAAPTGLTSDNTLTFQLIPGLGSPQTYYSCPYGVTVRLKPYYTVGTDGGGNYITSYTLLYTVVPRSLTVIAEDQTIPYATQPANSVRAGDGQLLPGHSVTATVRLDSARTGLEVEEGSVKVWDGTTDVSKYYDVTAYVPGILTATQSATTVRIPDSYPRDYVYGDTVALPEAEVTGAYASDVRYVWTDSQGAPVEQPRNAGSYTLTASIDETAQTTASSDSVQITIGKRPVTVTSLTASKVYDGTGNCDALQALTVELSGLVESETLLTGTDLRVGSLALSDPQGRFAVGEGYVLTADISLLPTAVADNYLLTNGQGFAGTASVTPRPIGEAAVEQLPDGVYDGSAHAPKPQISFGGIALAEGTDYTLTYSDNIHAGTATVTVTGIGNFSESRQLTFTVLPAALSGGRLELTGGRDFTYNGQTQQPGVRVLLTGPDGTERELTAGTDYSLACTGSDGTAADAPMLADTYTLTVTGIGDYSGTLTDSFTIARRQLRLTAQDQTAVYGDEPDQSAGQVVLDPATPLAEGDAVTSVTLVAKEASVARPGSVSAEAVVIMRGSRDVTGSYAVETVDGILTLTPLTLTQENTAVITDTLTFTGAEQSLTASDVVARVTLGNGTVETLAVGQRTLSGITGTKVGIYTLTITGKANFQGSVTAQWRIAPRLEDVTALTEDTVKTTDRAALEDFVRSVAPDQMVGVQVPPPAWAAAAEDCHALLEKLDQVEARLEELEALAEDPVTAQNVELADKERLEQELSSFEEALEDFATAPADNLTEEQKDWIEDQIRRLEEALAVVEEAQEVVDLVERLPDTTDPEDDVNDDAIHAAKERYDALSGNGKKLVDRETDGKLARLYDALTNYKIVKGNGSGWIRYSEGGLSFTANGAFSKFTGVKVDGKVLDPENYTAEEGSTVVTLKESWLDRQRNGKHTIQLTYTDGATGIGSFRIVTDSGNPFTGDMIMVAVAVMAVSGAALVVLLLLKKRK